MKAIALALTATVFFIGGTLAQPLRLVLRVDDVLSRNTTYIPRSIQPFEQVASLRGARVTWVTIPHRLIENTNSDGSLTRELRTTVQRGHEISQHGYNHICLICGSTGHEMWCATQSRNLTADQQRSLILDGRQILFDSVGVFPVTWVSPGHFEDSVTYALLGSNGFRYLSSTQRETGQTSSTLFNIRPASDYTWALTSQTYNAKLSEALNDARTAGEPAGVFVVLFHDPFIRQGYDNGIVLRWTAELLDSLRQRYGGRLRFLTLAQASGELLATSSTTFAESLMPQGFELTSYPNPFNGSAILRLRSPHAMPVDIVVYDALGQIVRTVGRRSLRPGEEVIVPFDASDLASGMYYVSARSSDATLTKKLVLIK